MKTLMNEKTLYLQHESSEQLLHQLISQIIVYLSLYYLNNLDFIPLHFVTVSPQ